VARIVSVTGSGGLDNSPNSSRAAGGAPLLISPGWERRLSVTGSGWPTIVLPAPVYDDAKRLGFMSRFIRQEGIPAFSVPEGRVPQFNPSFRDTPESARAGACERARSRRRFPLSSGEPVRPA